MENQYYKEIEKNYETYRNSVVKWVSKTIFEKNRERISEISDEIMQDACAIVLKMEEGKFEEGRGVALKTYFMGVVKILLKQYYRKDGTQKANHLSLEDADIQSALNKLGEEDEIAKEYDKLVRYKPIYDCLNKIGEKYKSLIIFRFWEEFEWDKICDLLGYSKKSTVGNTTLKRGLNYLRDCLKKNYFTELT